jgi:integrase
MRRAEAIQMQVDDFTEENLVLHGIWYKTRPIRTKGRGVQGKVLEKYVSKDIF